MSNILLVDDNSSMLYTLSNIFSDAGYSLKTAGTGKQAVEEIKKEEFELVILDYKLPDENGIQLLEKIKSLYPGIQVILLTAFGDIKNAVEAMKKGAADYITKPFDNQEMLKVINDVLKNKETNEKLNILQKKFNKSYLKTSMIISGSAMKEVLKQVELVAPTKMNVLIQGESGSGKELVANTIHNLSNRTEGLFVAVDCGAVPESLFESELFGYEKGAFTDAKGSKQGKFELANKGTIFLDEILNLSDSNQNKLLRIIEERKLTRLGGSEIKELDVRIISASNSNLFDAVGDNKFRADLFYRLNEFEIKIPPLRERKEDIPALVSQFILDANSELNKNVLELSKDSLRKITDYNWPGNVRELRNVIRKGVLLCDGNIIDDIILPVEIKNEKVDDFGRSFEISAKQAEREIIISVLKETGWNKTRTAKILKMNLRTLYRKIKTLNINEN